MGAVAMMRQVCLVAFLFLAGVLAAPVVDESLYAQQSDLYDELLQIEDPFHPLASIQKAEADQELTEALEQKEVEAEEDRPEFSQRFIDNANKVAAFAEADKSQIETNVDQSSGVLHGLFKDYISAHDEAKKTKKGEDQEMTPEFNAKIMQSYLEKEGNNGAIPSVLVHNMKKQVEDGSGILHVVKKHSGSKVVEVNSKKLGFQDSDVFDGGSDTDSLSLTKYSDKLDHVKKLPEISKEEHKEETAKDRAYKLMYHSDDDDDDGEDDPMADLLEFGLD